MIWLILALALVLRLINLDQSLWLDEATQAILSSKSIDSIIFQRSADFHPPLSYLLLHFWMKFGTGEVWLRLLSAVFGVGTVGLVFLLAGRMVDRHFGLLVAFLLTIAPYHIYFSQEVRMYSMATFFAALSMYFFYLSIKSGGLLNSVGYLVGTIALLYTHYLGFFLVVTQVMFVIWHKKEQMSVWGRNMTLVTAFWLPQLPQFLAQLQGGVKVDHYLPGWSNVLNLAFVKVIPLTFLKFAIGRIDFDNFIFYLVVSLVVLVGVGYLLINGVSSLKDDSRNITAWWLFAPIVLAWIVSLRLPINQPFRLLFVLPAFYLLLAAGLQGLGKLKTLLSWAVVLVSLGGLIIYFTNPKFWREDWRGATKFVNNHTAEDGVVVFAWPEAFPPFKWYGGMKGVGVVGNFPAIQDEVKQNLDQIKENKQIFLFEYLQALSDPQKLIQGWLFDHQFKLKRTYDFNGVGFVHHFVKSI